MRYSIMNFDDELAVFELARGQFSELRVCNIQVKSPVLFSLIGNDVEAWLRNRKPYHKRREIGKLLSVLGIKDLEGYFSTTYGLTLNDALWIRPESQSELKWRTINLYSSPFNRGISNFAFEGSGVVSGSTSPEFGTDGVLPKCWKRVNNTIYLYKGDSTANAGREPFSEDYASQVLTALGIDERLWVKYSCINYHNKKVSRCKLFTSERYGFRSQEKVFYTKLFEDLFTEQMKSPFAEFIKFMYVFDALILNEDRHLSNYGYMVDNLSGEIVGFAPIFDNGLGCIPYFHSNKSGDALLREVRGYADTRLTSSGASFELVAKACLTQDLRHRLNNLKSFKLSVVNGDNPDRVRCIYYMIQRQIRKILG